MLSFFYSLSFCFWGDLFRVISPSKQILDPMFIFLKERMRSSWGEVVSMTFVDLYFFKFFCTF